MVFTLCFALFRATYKLFEFFKALTTFTEKWKDALNLVKVSAYFPPSHPPPTLKRKKSIFHTFLTVLDNEQWPAKAAPMFILAVVDTSTAGWDTFVSACVCVCVEPQTKGGKAGKTVANVPRVKLAFNCILWKWKSAIVELKILVPAPIPIPIPVPASVSVPYPETMSSLSCLLCCAHFSLFSVPFVYVSDCLIGFQTAALRKGTVSGGKRGRGSTC